MMTISSVRDIFRLITGNLVNHVTLERTVAQQFDLPLQRNARLRQLGKLCRSGNTLPLQPLRRLKAEVAVDGMIPEIGKKSDRDGRNDQTAESSLFMMSGPHAGEKP